MNKMKPTPQELRDFDSNYKEKYGVIAGVDEAGRGPLAGPVVAAAVIIDEVPEGVFDSKKLTSSKRNILYDEILSNGYVGIGMATPEEIDLLNIFQATKTAMNRALGALRIKPDYTIVDGKYLNLNLPNECVISGDRLSASIGAASIIAKVYRDRIMENLNRLFPDFGFERHKGYGTSFHLDRLKKHGPTPWHRLTFRPVTAELTETLVNGWLDKQVVSKERLFRAGFLPARR